jgi:hypothetical protein
MPFPLPVDGAADNEGVAEGPVDKEGTAEGPSEGATEGLSEGASEGATEVEGASEGASEQKNDWGSKINRQRGFGSRARSHKVQLTGAAELPFVIPLVLLLPPTSTQSAPFKARFTLLRGRLAVPSSTRIAVGLASCSTLDWERTPITKKMASRLAAMTIMERVDGDMLKVRFREKIWRRSAIVWFDQIVRSDWLIVECGLVVRLRHA